MKILMLGSDANILKKNSDAQKRMIWYGSAFSEIHILVLSKKERGKEKQGKIKIKNVHIYSTNSKLRLFSFLDALFLGRKIIKEAEFTENDVVSAQDPFENGLMGFLISKMAKTKLQLQVHTDFLNKYFWQESLKNKIRMKIAEQLLPRADMVRVVSEKIRKSLLKFGFEPKRPIAVLPIYIDIEKIKKQKINTDLHKKYPHFDFICLMASRLTKEKNISIAIQAIDELKKIYTKIGLVVVGSGPELKNLKKEAESSKANIAFEPWTDDIYSYMKTSDLFLLTSNYEGYGRTIVEALLCELPVISTNVGAAKENDVMITKHNSQDLSEKISNFIHHPVKTDFVYEFKNKEQYLEKFKDIFY